MVEVVVSRAENCVQGEAHNASANCRIIFGVRVLENSMAMIIATVVLFWQAAGLSMAQILWLQAIFAVGLGICEVPSGYLADLLGRKRVIVIGLVSGCLGACVYAISSTFVGFVAAELLLAIGFSLISGADEALIYDSLASEGRESEFPRIWGRTLSFGYFSAALWAVLGGYLGAHELRLPWLWAGVLFGAASVLACALKEPQRTKRTVSDAGHIRDLLAIVKYCFTHNRTLVWLILYSAVLLGFNQVSVWFYQPYFVLCAIEPEYFGWLFAGMQIVAGFSSQYSAWIERRLGLFPSCLLALVLLLASYVLLGGVVYWWSFVFIAAHQFVRGFMSVVQSDYGNQNTTSDVRATTASLRSLTCRGFYILALLITSIFANGWTESSGVWSLLAIMVLLAGGGMLIARPKPS